MPITDKTRFHALLKRLDCLITAGGDYAIFLKEAAVEIEFEEKKYLIVPHTAILALVRIELSEAEGEPEA